MAFSTINAVICRIYKLFRHCGVYWRHNKVPRAKYQADPVIDLAGKLLDDLPASRTPATPTALHAPPDFPAAGVKINPATWEVFQIHAMRGQ